jgi:WD40 repeat protein/energy-coupling factor transporter ATP-binding protein EcfA2
MVEATSSSQTFALFILHAEPDTEFVRGYLLPAIGLAEADPHVMLPSKYALGRPILDELARAVRTSRFTVLVLSRATAADRWAEIGGVLAGTLAASGEQRLIPLYLEDVDVALTLRYLVPLEFRDRAEWDQQAAKLRRLLDQPGATRDRLICPYPGLAPFGAQHADRFFGREAQVRTLVRELEADNRRLCIIGPSGSGKSSLVQAGLLPQLERGSAVRAPWLVRSIRATGQPCARLAEALELERPTGLRAAAGAVLEAAGRSRLVVFVDQLEELFTLATTEERRRFAEALRELTADASCAVVVALRADFFGSLLESELWDDFERGRSHVTPLRREDLHRAIAEPASRVGVHLDKALVQRLLADTASEPGALPLLQATLLELWDTLEDRGNDAITNCYLTLFDYERLSGDGSTTIATALARRANAAVSHMTAAQQAIARRLFLSLVAFGEAGRHTRRQQTLATLRAAEDPGDFDGVVAALVDKRLLTTDHLRDPAGHDEATIDLSHEALITAWPELRAWIDTDRSDEERRRALTLKVAEWRTFGDVKLLDAVELLDAERWLDAGGGRAGTVPRLRELVERSRAALDAVRRQRDDAQRLLARSYQEHGRQLVREGRPMRALPYLFAARKADDERGVPEANAALQLLFAEVAHSLPISVVVHRDAIDRAAFGPDGIHVVTASRDHSALVWNAATGALLVRLDHAAAVLDAAWSPDGQRVVTAGADHLARVWRVDSGAPCLAPLAHGDRVHLATFSPDGARILTASWDRTTRIWDAASGYPIGPPIEHPAIITGVQFHPAGHRIVVCGKHREVRVIEVGGAVICALGHDNVVRSAAFSRDGTRIVTASSDRTARVWDPVSGAAIATIAHGAPVTRAAFDAQGGRIVTISDDSARVWDAVSGEPVSPVMRHADRVVGAGFTADGTRVVTASWDRTARIWDVVSGAPWSAPFEHAREVLSAVVCPGDRRVLTTSADGTARTWDVAAERSGQLPLAHARRWVTGVAFDAAGERVVTAGADHTARVWNVETGDASLPALSHDARVTSASFSPDGTCIVSVSANTATLWSAATGSRVAQLAHATSSIVASASFSPDGARIVTAGSDQQVRLWDAASGRMLLELAHTRAVTFAAFSPDGTRLVTTCADGRARIWLGSEPRCLIHDDTVSHAAFRRDGRRLATASKDHTARIWDVATTAPCGPPIRHAEAVLRVAWSPDNARVLTLSGNTARLWDASSGKPVVDPLEHRGRVHAASFSRDGALLVVASDDGGAWLWDLGSGKLLATPFVHATRVNDVAFSADGRRLATASGDSIARLWTLTFETGSLSAWSALAGRCPYELLDGVLVERPFADSGSGSLVLTGHGRHGRASRRARS